jgi:C-terminal processing protease CtpA/Prc
VIGFEVEVEGDGSFWKPVIKSAKVVGVRSGSPAEAAGLEVGDEILSVQGVEVADSNARKIAKLVQVNPGEHLRLVVRDVAGEVKEIDIIAGLARLEAEAGA